MTFKAKKVRAAAKKKSPEESPIKIYIPPPDDVNEPPDDLQAYMVCIFGAKGIGKSTLGAYWGRRKESDPNKSIILMSEPNRKNLRVRRPIQFKTYTAKEIMEGSPDPWEQLKELTPQLIDDPTVEHISFDSIDLFYEMAQHSVSAANGVTNPSKAGKESSGVWIELRDEFKSYFDTLKETGMGILLLSHIKTRDVETVDGSKFDQIAPSCAPACLQYIKAACDFVFHYSWHNNQRCMVIRDPGNDIWTACGVQDRFCEPTGKQVERLAIPNDFTQVYSTLENCFDNKEWDADTDEDERDIQPKPRKKRR
jgi:hypothetical protein